MSMNCFACIKTCPNHALKLEHESACAWFEEKTPLRMDEEHCDECNLCNDVCPLGGIELSGEGCMFCIVCKSRPSCLVTNAGEGVRDSFCTLLTSIARYVMVRCRIIVQ
ncbi:MAG: hypothetical protein EFT35_02795 [Methanophagales archaeon ANME-1-THS]|nr:MAG: hypothetical protein EFT35_02795 [Methanophagales archaeon ANME-1-THS]